ncbi:hypothetical protein PtB15_6B357 [Puccinia triticina]|nr:hypothetical protein PtB15_6B357 [Puccinia triticina]
MGAVIQSTYHLAMPIPQNDGREAAHKDNQADGKDTQPRPGDDSQVLTPNPTSLKIKIRVPVEAGSQAPNTAGPAQKTKQTKKKRQGIEDDACLSDGSPVKTALNNSSFLAVGLPATFPTVKPQRPKPVRPTQQQIVQAARDLAQASETASNPTSKCGRQIKVPAPRPSQAAPVKGNDSDDTTSEKKPPAKRGRPKKVPVPRTSVTFQPAPLTDADYNRMLACSRANWDERCISAGETSFGYTMGISAPASSLEANTSTDCVKRQSRRGKK